MSVTFPRISFGIIVLNGEPFTKYCLRQLYSHSHEIIVVEGGSKKAMGFAPEGCSTDDTLEALYEFKEKEDPKGKVKIITKKGFWEEKDEQSQAFADIATGDYLWQVDIDEFYKHNDIEKVKSLLRGNPDIDAISFSQITFWGWFDYYCDSIFLRDVFTDVTRVLRWKRGYKFIAHRPPTVIDQNGIDLRKKKWISARDTEKMTIFLYHYSLLFPKQVKEKCSYYSTPGEVFKNRADRWAEGCYFKINKPFRVHNVYTYPSWLMQYKGSHPEQIEQMRSDILSEKLKVDIRETADIERLLSSKIYSLKRNFLILLDKLMVFKILIIIRQIIINFLRLKKT